MKLEIYQNSKGTDIENSNININEQQYERNDEEKMDEEKINDSNEEYNQEVNYREEENEME